MLFCLCAWPQLLLFVKPEAHLLLLELPFEHRFKAARNAMLILHRRLDSLKLSGLLAFSADGTVYLSRMHHRTHGPTKPQILQCTTSCWCQRHTIAKKDELFGVCWNILLAMCWFGVWVETSLAGC